MLLHIVRIDLTEARHIVSPIVIGETAAVVLPHPAPWQRLPLAGLATLESQDTLEKGVRLTTTKLTATLRTDRLPYSGLPWAYRLHTACGRTYLLGLPSPPYPLTTFEARLPGTPAEVSAITLTVSQTTDHPPLHLVE